MKTEIILFSQQLFANPKFSNVSSNYGWETTDNWIASAGKITKVAPGVGTLFQENVCIEGGSYRCKFTITGRTAGNFGFRNVSSGTLHANVSTNATHVIDFTADGPDLIFSTTLNFDGVIQNCSLTPLPEQHELELSGTETMPLNFNIDDIFELGKRKTTWTKTVTIPGTHANNRAFSHIYKINSEGLFDPRLKARAIVKADGITMIDGMMSLDGINKFVDGSCSYQVQIVGRLSDMISKFGDRTMKDLDFSQYDHEFNLMNLQWNWGRFSSGSGHVAGFGYCWDTQNVSSDPTKPGLVLYTSSASHIRISSLTQVSFGGNSVVRINWTGAHPFAVGDEILIKSVNKILSGMHTVLAVPASNQTTIDLAWDNLTSTTTSNITDGADAITWQGKGYWYPLQDNGSYLKEISSGQLRQGQIYYVLERHGLDDFDNLSINPYTGASFNNPQEGDVFMADDGVSAAGFAVTPTSWASGTRLLYPELPENDAILYSKETFINNWFAMDLVPHIFVREVFTKMMALIDYDWECTTFDTKLFKRLVMPVDQGFNVTDTTGQWVRLNDWLPGMKLIDFFTSLLNMFNLVVIEDKDIPNKISLVSRNDFYDSGEQVDWPLDAKQPLNIKLSNYLLPKYYHFKNAESADFYNTDYNREIGNLANTSGIAQDIDRRYGDYYTNTRNEHKDKGNIIQTKFESTVLAGPQTLSPGGIYIDSDKTISVTYAADEDGTNIKRHKAFRILIAGWRGTDNPWSISSWNVNFGANSVFGDPAFNSVWPYAGHIDNVFAAVPYYDINWGPLQGQYFSHEYDQDDWLEHTLIGLYWRRYLDSITDRSARHVTGTFRLKVKDIYELDFRNMVRPENCDFTMKLQKISDWDMNGTGLCKCEFLL